MRAARAQMLDRWPWLETVECVLGERQFAGSDRGQQRVGAGPSHVCVGALGPIDSGQRVDETTQPKVGPWSHQGGEVGTNDAPRTRAASEPLRLAAADGALQFCRDAGAVATDRASDAVPPGEHAVLVVACRAGAVGVGCFGEANAADPAVWPLDANLGHVGAMAPVAGERADGARATAAAWLGKPVQGSGASRAVPSGGGPAAARRISRDRRRSGREPAGSRSCPGCRRPTLCGGARPSHRRPCR